MDNYKNHPNITIIHQENKGVSSARNTGMNAIIGRYVTFVDSDDELLQGAIDALLDKAFAGDYDIVGGGYEAVNSKGSRKVITPRDGYLYGFACTKVYKRELWRQLQFNEGYWYEDTISALVLHRLAGKVATIPMPVYRYWSNPTSITHTARRSRPKKTIDSLYITLRLYGDREKLNIAFTLADYEQLLRQIQINTTRIAYLSDRKADLANFTISRHLLNTYGSPFIGKSSNCKALEKALLDANFRQFRLAAIFL